PIGVELDSRVEHAGSIYGLGVKLPISAGDPQKPPAVQNYLMLKLSHYLAVHSGRVLQPCCGDVLCQPYGPSSLVHPRNRNKPHLPRCPRAVQERKPVCSASQLSPPRSPLRSPMLWLAMAPWIRIEFSHYCTESSIVCTSSRKANLLTAFFSPLTTFARVRLAGLSPNSHISLLTMFF